MKTNERNICRNIRREIEEAGQAEPLTLAVEGHLQGCVSCNAFYDEQLKLRQLVSSLGTVAAPNDFDFRLRARLARERGNPRRLLSIGKLSFGYGTTAFAVIMLLMGSVLLAVSLRPTINNSLTANVPSNEARLEPTKPQTVSSLTSPEATNTGDIALQGAIAAVSDKSNSEANLSEASDSHKRVIKPRAPRGALAGNRVRTRDMGSAVAKVLRPGDLVAAGHTVFPIDSSPQALKVSLGNGRGSSKTVSVPGVSFGSQRVLTQNSSPLLASSRGAW